MSSGKNGKGSGRRLSTVPAENAAANWEYCLGKKIMPWEANTDEVPVSDKSQS